MNAPAVLLLTAGGVLLFAASSSARASIEAPPGEWAPTVSLENLYDQVESTVNVITQTPDTTPADVGAANLAAFLGVIRQAEGTDGLADPWAACFGYSHTISDTSDHPAITGEWTGKRLTDDMCANAGFGPGCVSTAAGAYQIIKPTWIKCRNALGLPDFGRLSQDSAAAYLIDSRGALQDVRAGRFAAAVGKCRNEWASLPGNYAKQGQRSMAQLEIWYRENGGTFA